jgi:peroxiredoxin
VAGAVDVNRRRSLLIGTVAGLVAVLAAVGVAAAMGTDDGTPKRHVDADLHFTPKSQDVNPLIEGDHTDDPAPTSKYPKLDGGLGSLADYKGQNVVLNMFGSYCVPCKKEMPDLEKLHRELGDQVTFVGLAVNDSQRDAQAFVDEYGATYDIGRDPGGKIASELGVVNMPSTFLIGKDGQIKSAKAGAVTASELRKLIEGNLTEP